MSNTGHSDEKLIVNNNKIISQEKNKKNENELSEQSLIYYENKYLLNGKIFIYPDSIPINYIPYDKKDHEIPSRF